MSALLGLRRCLNGKNRAVLLHGAEQQLRSVESSHKNLLSALWR